MLRSACSIAFLCLLCAAAAPAALAQGSGENPLGEPDTASPPPATESADPRPVAPPRSAAAPPPASSPAPAAPAAQQPKSTGLLFEVGLGASMTVFNQYTSQLQQIGASFLLGYKLNRVAFGLGLEITNNATYEDDGTDKDHNTTTSVLFKPTLQFHLLESGPLAMLLDAGLHVGFAAYDETGTEIDDHTDIILVGFHLGLGMRYFFHPRFALGAQAGYRGLWVLSKFEQSGFENDTTVGIGSIYGQILCTFIW
jgi:hypothetical protein